MPGCAVHAGIECREVNRILFGKDIPGGVQVNGMVRMRILRIAGLDPVIAGCWKKDWSLCKLWLQFCLGDHTGFFITKEFAVAEMAAVMGKAEIVAREIFPRPVETCELTEISVFGRDIISCIIPRIAEIRFSFPSDMEREIHGIGWHPVCFMGGNDDFDI